MESLTPSEVAESFINGNISWTLDELDKRPRSFTREVLEDLGMAGGSHSYAESLKRAIALRQEIRQQQPRRA